MSLLFCDSFEHWTAAADGITKWNSNSTGSATVTTKIKTGSRSYPVGGSTVSYNGYNKGSTFNSSIMFLQFHLYLDGSDTSNQQGVDWAIEFYNDSNALQSKLLLTTDRRFKIMRDVNLVAENTDFRLQYNTWHFIQIKWRISNALSSNDLVVKVDGVEILNPSSGDTAHQSNTNLQYVRFKGISSVNRNYMDNLIIMDNQGSVNNALTSTDTFIEKIIPNGAGNYTQWTPSAGANYAAVDDDAAPDDDTTYVQTSGVGNKDSYAYGNMVAASPTIIGLAANIFAKRTTAVARTVKQFTRISSTDYEQTGGHVETTSYDFDQAIWEISPATSSAWTDTEINGAEFGIKLES